MQFISYGSVVTPSILCSNRMSCVKERSLRYEIGISLAEALLNSRFVLP